MIEVEKKFRLRPGDKEKLIQGATFLKEKQNHDVYFDTPSYALTTKDQWLRRRNGKWELKIGMNDSQAGERSVDRYKELDSEQEIRSTLGLSGLGLLTDDLVESGYSAFADFVTTRQEYQHGDFIIDIDEMSFGDTQTEIELLVQEEGAVSGAVERILVFATDCGLKLESVPGKTPEYIRRHNPVHYKALQKAGVV